MFKNTSSELHTYGTEKKKDSEKGMLPTIVKNYSEKSPITQRIKHNRGEMSM